MPSPTHDRDRADAATGTPSRRAFLRRSLGLAAGVVTACSGSGRGKAGSPTTGTDTRAADPAAVARDGFLAAYPLVTTTRTMATFALLAGVNRPFASGGLVNPSSHLVVAPNRDTVYALVVFDLRAGPQVLTVPDIPDRYHVFQFLDAWMGGFGLVGTRTTGGRGGAYVIVPAGYDGPIPAGARRLVCPTTQGIVLGRIRAVDDGDAAVAGVLAKQVRVAPLDAGATPAPDMARPAGTPQSVGANGLTFYDELADALAVNPPVTPEQRDAIDALHELGVGAGRRLDPGAGGADLTALRQGIADGLRRLADPAPAGGHVVDGWNVNLELGGDDTKAGLLQRATVARYFWGPVPAAEAVYPRATSGSDGRPLDGSKRYVIHFPKGGLPPVDAFWSFTVYGSDMFLVRNRENRYSLSGQSPGLTTNADGSLDVYLQRDAPPGREANWLPVPAAGFNVIMRLYLPGRAVLDDSYRYPALTVAS
jgi:hypothetical protein